MSKLKVATRTLVLQERMKKIIAVLKNFPEGATPKTIAYHTEINVNTTKSILQKIKQIKKKEGIRGLYVLVDESQQGSIFDWNFHNGILTCEIPSYMGKRITKSFNFEFIHYEFEIGAESKQATLRVSTKHPLNICSICACYIFFSNLIKSYTDYNVSGKVVKISSIEFNKDYQNLRLDGIKCITLDSLIEQLKIYQKENAVRTEYKLKVPIELEAILSILRDMPKMSDIRQELSEIKKQEELHGSFLRRVGDSLNAILNKLDKINPIKRVDV